MSSSVDTTDDWNDEVKEYGSSVSTLPNIPSTAAAVTSPIQFLPAPRPASRTQPVPDMVGKTLSGPLLAKLPLGSQNRIMAAVSEREEVKVDIGMGWASKPNNHYGSELSGSQPISPLLVPGGNNLGSELGARNYQHSVGNSYMSPRLIQIEGDTKAHRRNKSAPAILAFPPLPAHFSEMNDQDKEEMLKKWITMDSEQERDFSEVSFIMGKDYSADDGQVKREIQDANFPLALQEGYNHYLRSRHTSSVDNTTPSLKEMNGAGPGANEPSAAAAEAALAAVPNEDARNSFLRAPGEAPEDEKKPSTVDLPLPLKEEKQRSWTLFADGDGSGRGDKKRRKKYRAKTKSYGKKLRDFEFARMEQIIVNHEGSVWTMKFNSDGKYLATGGQDAIVRVWTVTGSRADKGRWKRKPRKETRYRNTVSGVEQSGSETPGGPPRPFSRHKEKHPGKAEAKPPKGSIINPIPLRKYHGHKMDIIDIDWSNGTDFILSCSLDATVMLWHTSKEKCLCIFQHADYVTSIRFHPTNSTYFVSASFDSRIRLWNILDHRVVAWRQLETLATAVAFSPNGKIIVAGLYDGQCVFFNVDMERFQLNWHQKVDCRNRRSSGKKVTSIQYLPIEKVGEEDPKHKGGSNQCLVTTNDSRIRLFTLENYQINLTTKYKGIKNSELQIAATFSHDGRHVICGSEDGAVYIWSRQITNSPFISLKKTTHKKTKAHEIIRAPGSKKDTATVAIFAPPGTVTYIARDRENKTNDFPPMPKFNHIILSADNAGVIKVFVNYATRPGFEAGMDIQGVAEGSGKGRRSINRMSGSDL